MQNKSGTANASTNWAVSNDLATDSSYYGEFGMNSSVFSASTPADFFSINNGIYFSGHDGDLSIGSGNGFKTYFAWGTTGQSAHVINVSGAIGLNTNLGTTPATSGTTNFGTAGQVLTSQGSASTPTWTTISGGVTTFSAGTTGLTPSTATSGAVTLAGTLAVANGGTGITAFGTGVATALGSNVTGSGGIVLATSPTLVTPALGTPASGVVTNLTGTASININGTVGATTATTGAFTTVSATGVITSTLATGTAPFTVASTTQVANLNAATAGNATNATNTAITDDTTTATSCYPTWVTTTTGNLPQKTASTKLSFVPSTGVLSATTFSGAGTSLTGTAASLTAGTASALTTGNNYQVASLGVGTAASGTAGEIRATNNVTAYYSSDKQFKENIKDIENALDIVKTIGGKEFDWTDTYIAEKGGADGYFVQKQDFGVIAQDVQSVFPKAVRTREDGTLAVDYSKLVALSFAAITELTKRLEVLENNV
jgi:hypothetical protein